MLKGSQAAGDASGPGTTVGVNVALSGTLKDQNDINIYGLVDGEVVSEKSVTVGKTAQVKGPVRGAVVTIAGVVRGSIDAAERLELLDTAKIFGSISTKDLVIHSGAVFVGKCTMQSELAEGEEVEVPVTEEASAKKTKESSGDTAVNDTELKPEEE
jgi:cytoskeletal protein CcmA (bactofilin family)